MEFPHSLLPIVHGPGLSLVPLLPYKDPFQVQCVILQDLSEDADHYLEKQSDYHCSLLIYIRSVNMSDKVSPASDTTQDLYK